MINDVKIIKLKLYKNFKNYQIAQEFTSISSLDNSNLTMLVYPLFAAIYNADLLKNIIQNIIQMN